VNAAADGPPEHADPLISLVRVTNEIVGVMSELQIIVLGASGETQGRGCVRTPRAAGNIPALPNGSSV
jgi:hypothetical protein